MKQYPYIARLKSDDIKMALFTSPSTATALTDNFADIKLGESDSEWDESFYTNITREYLSNTWGVVESKEHAEFIIELAELHGFEFLANGGSGNKKSFYIGNKSFTLLIDEPRFKTGCKKITIPLPPKAKEWEPEVGDEVLTSDELGVIKSTADSKGFYAVLIDGEYSLLHFTEFEKPKPKQDLLIEELQTKLCNNNAVDNYILACDIINGDIEGLSYEV